MSRQSTLSLLRLNHRDRILDGCGTRLLNDRLYLETLCANFVRVFRGNLVERTYFFNLPIELPVSHLIAICELHLKFNICTSRNLATISDWDIIIYVFVIVGGSQRTTARVTLLILRLNHRDLALWCRICTWIGLCAVFL